MIALRERRNRHKLLFSSIALAAVLLVAAVAQRSHRALDPFPAEGTRTRVEPEGAGGFPSCIWQGDEPARPAL